MAKKTWRCFAEWKNGKLVLEAEHNPNLRDSLINLWTHVSTRKQWLDLAANNPKWIPIEVEVEDDHI